MHPNSTTRKQSKLGGVFFTESPMNESMSKYWDAPYHSPATSPTNHPQTFSSWHWAASSMHDCGIKIKGPPGCENSLLGSTARGSTISYWHGILLPIYWENLLHEENWFKMGRPANLLGMECLLGFWCNFVGKPFACFNCVLFVLALIPYVDATN